MKFLLRLEIQKTLREDKGLLQSYKSTILTYSQSEQVQQLDHFVSDITDQEKEEQKLLQDQIFELRKSFYL